MRIVVVCESMFGNTKRIAEAIAEGCAGDAEVLSGNLDEISPEQAGGADLLFIGGPTQGFGMPRQDARRDLSRGSSAKKMGPPLPGSEDLRGWLDRLPSGRGRAAAFDTRFDKPRWLTGSAAKQIAKELEGKGFSVAAQESFFVLHSEGPLKDGEIERASAWARALVADAGDAGRTGG